MTINKNIVKESANIKKMVETESKKETPDLSLAKTQLVQMTANENKVMADFIQYKDV